MIATAVLKLGLYQVRAEKSTGPPHQTLKSYAAHSEVLLVLQINIIQDLSKLGKVEEVFSINFLQGRGAPDIHKFFKYN